MIHLTKPEKAQRAIHAFNQIKIPVSSIQTNLMGDNRCSVTDKAGAKYEVKLCEDDRVIVLLLGEETFPHRGFGSTLEQDIFLNKAKFAQWKWVIAGTLIREWPPALIDPATGNVLYNEDNYYAN